MRARQCFVQQDSNPKATMTLCRGKMHRISYEPTRSDTVRPSDPIPNSGNEVDRRYTEQVCIESDISDGSQTHCNSSACGNLPLYPCQRIQQERDEDEVEVQMLAFFSGVAQECSTLSFALSDVKQRQREV